MNNTENKQLIQQLRDFFRTENFELTRLNGGASSRKYYLIEFNTPSYFGRSKVVLMTVPLNERTVMEDYMNIDYYLRRHGIKTPRLFEMELSHGWIFQEYLIHPLLNQYLETHPEHLENALLELFNFLKELQARCTFEQHCPAFQRKFDINKYLYEFNFHVSEQLLKQYLKVENPQDYTRELAEIISHFLDIDYPIFVHRDFQSSNLFIETIGESYNFYVIDFQDARHGTPIYDLVSFLWDSYIHIPENLRNTLIKEYFSFLIELNIQWDWEYYRKIVDFTAIQRKLHDAGAFAYNHLRFNNAHYTPYIKPAIEMALHLMHSYREFHNIAPRWDSLLKKL